MLHTWVARADIWDDDDDDGTDVIRLCDTFRWFRDDDLVYGSRLGHTRTRVRIRPTRGVYIYLLWHLILVYMTVVYTQRHFTLIWHPLLDFGLIWSLRIDTWFWDIVVTHLRIWVEIMILGLSVSVLETLYLGGMECLPWPHTPLTLHGHIQHSYCYLDMCTHHAWHTYIADLDYPTVWVGRSRALRFTSWLIGSCLWRLTSFVDIFQVRRRVYGETPRDWPQRSPVLL